MAEALRILGGFTLSYLGRLRSERVTRLISPQLAFRLCCGSIVSFAQRRRGCPRGSFPAVLRRRSDLKGHLPLPEQHIHRCGDESYDLLWPRRRGASPLVIGF